MKSVPTNGAAGLLLAQIAILASGLAACGAAIETSQEKLENSVRELNEAVRWGRAQEALALVHVDSRDHFSKLHAEFGRAIRISDYEIVQSTVSSDNAAADIGIRIVWYRIDRMEVHQTELVQHWEKHDRVWYLMTETYRSGTPF